MDDCMLSGADNIDYWLSCFFQKKQLLGLADYSALSNFAFLDDETTREKRIIPVPGMRFLVKFLWFWRR